MAGKRSITWFPGHMRQAINALRRVIKGVDLVLEVRDARVPLSSNNPELSGLLGQKRHIVVLNKSDLVPSRLHKATLAHLQQGGLKVVSASCSTAAGVQQVMDSALEWLRRERAASELSIMLVLGLPNSGKSSLINACKLAATKQGLLTGEEAHQKKARVGLTPGLTRQVAGLQVCAEPAVYVLDSPGIMVPAVPSDEVGYRLALAGAIKDSVVGEEAIVRYMLQYLGRDLQHSLRAIKASGPLGAKRGGSSRKGPSSTQHSKSDREADRMRACLHSVLSSSAQQPLLHASAAGRGDELQPEAWGGGDSEPFVQDGVHAFGDTNLPPWVVTDSVQHDDGPVDPAVQRYEQLLACLGVAGVRNPSKELGALIRLLRAFREGQFGNFLLDDEAVRQQHGCN